MERPLRIDKPKSFQKLLCFFSLYHPYKYWSGGRKEDNRYAHFRRCRKCNKLQIKTFYRAGCNLIAHAWNKVDINDRNEPEQN